MSKKKKPHSPRPATTRPAAAMVFSKRRVVSLLDEMKDRKEFQSLVDVVPHGMDFRNEMTRAIDAIEDIRKRPIVVYAANVVRQPPGAPVGIVQSDDLPFAEMVAAVPAAAKALDVLLVTPRGSGRPVAHFVSWLHPRFDDVAFILPHMAFSAGTIWALFGDSIWMDDRALLGPIDPQVPGTAHLNVVLNFSKELKRRAPEGTQP